MHQAPSAVRRDEKQRRWDEGGQLQTWTAFLGMGARPRPDTGAGAVLEKRVGCVTAEVLCGTAASTVAATGTVLEKVAVRHRGQRIATGRAGGEWQSDVHARRRGMTEA